MKHKFTASLFTFSLVIMPCLTTTDMVYGSDSSLQQDQSDTKSQSSPRSGLEPTSDSRMNPGALTIIPDNDSALFLPLSPLEMSTLARISELAQLAHAHASVRGYSEAEPKHSWSELRDSYHSNPK